MSRHIKLNGPEQLTHCGFRKSVFGTSRLDNMRILGNISLRIWLLNGWRQGQAGGRGPGTGAKHPVTKELSTSYKTIIRKPAFETWTSHTINGKHVAREIGSMTLDTSNNGHKALDRGHET